MGIQETPPGERKPHLIGYKRTMAARFIGRPVGYQEGKGKEGANMGYCRLPDYDVLLSRVVLLYLLDEWMVRGPRAKER
jgi:hypothetical protein